MQNRITSGKTFTQAMLEPIYAFGTTVDKNGNSIRPIRHLRVRATGSGSAKPASIRERESFLSKKGYKNFDYAVNGEVPVCIIYETILKDKIEKGKLNHFQFYN